MPIKSYKGTDENMRCRGLQYKIGEEHETDSAVVCEQGFHACKVPLNVFSYYTPATSRYFSVTQDGELSMGVDKSKISSTKIKLDAEIGIPGIVKAHIEYIKENLKKGDEVKESGDQSAATNTGYRSAATNTGCQSAASVSGKDSVAIVTGFRSKAKAGLGSAIVVVERGEWNGETCPVVAIKAAIVDGKILKPDVWYTLKDGEFVEVDNESSRWTSLAAFVLTLLFAGGADGLMDALGPALFLAVGAVIMGAACALVEVSLYG